MDLQLQMPDSMNTPWIVNWCQTNDKINHFTLRFANSYSIGYQEQNCEECKGEEPSTVELLYKNKLNKIIIQKHEDSSSIRAIFLIDDSDHVTVINKPNTDTRIFFDPHYWKVFNIEPDEQLMSVTKTDDFDKIEFIVGKIPTPRQIQ